MDPLSMQAMLAANMGMAPGPAPTGTEAAGTMPTLPPQLDPAAQMYMTQMMQSLLLQNQAQQSMAAAAGGLAGMPPAFPGMAPPYSQSSTDPTITVSVEGMKFQYQLTEDDLHKVFSRYGGVKQIRVDEAGASATVSFAQIHDAQSAMTDLNGKVLNGLDGTLRINWLTQAAPAPFPVAPYSAMPFPGGWGGGFPPAAPSAGALPGGAMPPPASAAGGGCSSYGGGGGGNDKSPHSKGIRKYTCRFLIGIENDKDFQVARRIIGAKGANMKRIVKTTEAKLRLRGVGSGYYEGAGQKESSEPLQLCVSCTTPDGYKIAVAGVEELLMRVYDEYMQYCVDNNMEVPNLHIQLSENQLVYSSRFGPGGGASGGANGDDAQSPRQGGGARRGRRSRGKRDSRNSEGELERGEPGPNAPSMEEIEQFIDNRNEARRANNFSEADRIRDLLHERGVALMDEPGGRGRGAEVTTWRYWRD